MTLRRGTAVMAQPAQCDPFRRERTITLATVLGVAGLAWVYLSREAARMQATMSTGMPGMEDAPMASMTQVWSLDSLLLTFLMWSVMMTGMMLPSALPAILLYGSLARKNVKQRRALPSVWIFTAGYLAVWTGFSLAVTLVQAGLQDRSLLTPMMVSGSHWLTGSLLIVAGLYQWLPVKDACLRKCRTPLQLFLFRWRTGRFGAFRMGAEHGTFCVGCCWALMLLLFAAGVMNLIWVALIAGFVLIEKVLPQGRLIGRVAGGALAAVGAAAIVAA